MSRPPAPSSFSSAPFPRTVAACAGAIVLLIALAYANSFSGGFVYDDRSSVVTNTTIAHLWPLGPVLAPPAEFTTGGRPLANVSFALSYAVSGLAPWGHHFVNLLTHTLAALAVLGTLHRTFLLPALRTSFAPHALSLATAITALWALHPLQTQVVAYVSQRTESLMALFYLLTLYCFIRSATGRPRLWLPLAVLACLLGALCKEVIVTAPLVVLLFDRTFVAGSFAAALRLRWKFYAALAATWIPLALLLQGLRERGVGFDTAVPWIEYPLTQCRAILVYLKLCFWPHPLVFDYGVDRLPTLAAAAPFALGLVTLLVLSAWALVTRPALGFLAAGFFLVLAPTSSVVPILFQPIAENRAYLPLAAVLTLIVLALHRLAGRNQTFVACAVLTATSLLATHHRNKAYRTDFSLWGDTLAKRPENPRAHYNLAVAYDQAGRYSDSIPHYETTLRLDPHQPHAHNNLGIAFLKNGRPAAAVAQFEQAVRLKPDFADAHSNLAVALSQVGRLADAVTHTEVALRLKPDYPDARRNLEILRSLLATASAP